MSALFSFHSILTTTICLIFLFFPTLLVHPGYSLADYDVMSQSVKDQLRHSLVRHEYETKPTPSHNLPTKQLIINMLATQGQWITSCPELQVCLISSNGCAFSKFFMWNNK